MIRGSIRADVSGFVDRYRRFCIQRLEKVALQVSHAAAVEALGEIRGRMRDAGLGRLSNAITMGSDLKKGRGVKRRGREAFSASAWIYVRGRSERTIGAIEAYTVGAEIRPVNAQWLWIATDAIPKRVNRFKMTPALYNRSGLVQSIGPLQKIEGRHPGEALLVVKNVTMRTAGGGRARRVPQRGMIGRGREQRDVVVAFVGIKRTARAARVNVPEIIRANVAKIPNRISAAMSGDL